MSTSWRMKIDMSLICLDWLNQQLGIPILGFLIHVEDYSSLIRTKFCPWCRFILGQSGETLAKLFGLLTVFSWRDCTRTQWVLLFWLYISAHYKVTNSRFALLQIGPKTNHSWSIWSPSPKSLLECFVKLKKWKSEEITREHCLWSLQNIFNSTTFKKHFQKKKRKS